MAVLVAEYKAEKYSVTVHQIGPNDFQVRAEHDAYPNGTLVYSTLAHSEDKAVGKAKWLFERMKDAPVEDTNN